MWFESELGEAAISLYLIGLYLGSSWGWIQLGFQRELQHVKPFASQNYVLHRSGFSLSFLIPGWLGESLVIFPPKLSRLSLNSSPFFKEYQCCARHTHEILSCPGLSKPFPSVNTHWNDHFPDETAYCLSFYSLDPYPLLAMHLLLLPHYSASCCFVFVLEKAGSSLSGYFKKYLGVFLRWSSLRINIYLDV